MTYIKKIRLSNRCFIFLIFVSLFYKTSSELLKEFSIQVPGYSPTIKDDYISVMMRAEIGYIVKFEPVADASRVHHMFLYGCEVPLFNTSFWKGDGNCKEGYQYIYGWARNAPGLELPKNVGISIGHVHDKIQYIGLEVHYVQPFVGNVKDFSGITLLMSENRPTYLAGIYLFVKTEATIPPKRSEFLVNTSCEYKNDTLLYPFAFRTHTHSMGRVVSAFVKHEKNWTLIGKRNPQWSQGFQPIHDKIIIHPGDILAATCRFDSTNKNDPTELDSGETDEMCNFFMMYYTDGESSQENPPICSEEVNHTIVAEYPSEGISLLPSRSDLEWEHTSHHNNKPFGVEQRMKTEWIDDEYLGGIAGLSFDKDGHLVIFHRGSRDFDETSIDPIPEFTILVTYQEENQLHLKARYGNSLFYMPHGFAIDQDNFYYTTDVTSLQVTKWEISNGELKEIWTIGEKFVSGKDKSHFCKPASIAISKQDGGVFITDGPCNRIIRFTSYGYYLTEWSIRERRTRISPPIPHDISLNEDKQELYIADRLQDRVVVFSFEGKLLHEINNDQYTGDLHSVDYSHEHGIFYISGPAAEENATISAFVVPPNSTKMQYSFQPFTENFQKPHVIRVDKNFIWVGEITQDGGKLWKFELMNNQMNTVEGFHSELSVSLYSEFYSNDTISIILLCIVVFLSFSFIFVLIVFRKKIVDQEFNYKMLG